MCLHRLCAGVLRLLPLSLGLLLVESLPAQPYELLKIEANAARGFHWPYYLSIPASLKTPTVLLVVPNNTGFPTDDQTMHDQSARDAALWFTLDDDLRQLGSPILVPTFPRPGGDRYGYTQALDRRALQTKVPNLVRLDNQLVAMIEDARTRLAARKVTIDAKVWMFGFSASGSFTSRFTALHPEAVKAASIGAPYICPIIPVSQWNDVPLPFMVGVADFQEVTGKAFDAAAFRKVPQFIYIGGDEVTEAEISAATPYDPDGFHKAVSRAFGTPVAQYAGFEAAYNSIGASAEIVVFPGLRHAYAKTGNYLEFYERHRAASPPPRPKPLLYTLYFPVVLSTGDWNTVLTLINGTPGVPIKGELRGYSADGGPPVETVPFSIAGSSRRRIPAREAFASPQSVSYVVVQADSAFLSGEATLVYEPAGGTVSLPAAASAQRGCFLRQDAGAWTALSLVNIADAPASVLLSARNDDGAEVASATITLAAGARLLAEPSSIFGADVAGATYVRFSSNRKLIGFALHARDGGAVLEALPAQPDYVR